MKPKLKTELIRVDYWDCGNQNHRHKTEAVASACMEKRDNRAGLANGARKWTEENSCAVLKRRQEGERLCDLARNLGISVATVKYVLNKAENFKQAEISYDPLNKLSVRTRNSLKAWELDTVEEISAALEDGSLKKIPNLGKVSLEEIRKWLGAFDR